MGGGVVVVEVVVVVGDLMEVVVERGKNVLHTRVRRVKRPRGKPPTREASEICVVEEIAEVGVEVVVVG